MGGQMSKSIERRMCVRRRMGRQIDGCVFGEGRERYTDMDRWTSK